MKKQLKVLVFCCKEGCLSSVARNQFKKRFSSCQLSYSYDANKINSYRKFLIFYNRNREEYLICVCLDDKNKGWNDSLRSLEGVIIVYKPVVRTYAGEDFITHSFYESYKQGKKWYKNIRLRKNEIRYLYGISRR